METFLGTGVVEILLMIKSPLAGDINWMETSKEKDKDAGEKSPLAGDINWMETNLNKGMWGSLSPLAGDINWMET